MKTSFLMIASVWVALSAATEATAQPSEEQIAAAIEDGLQGKGESGPRIDSGNMFATTNAKSPFVVRMSGPLNRIYDAAAQAGKAYRTFGRADVTASMLAETVSITALPKTPTPGVSHEPFRAMRIVLQTRTKPPVTVQPQADEPIPIEWTNGFGAKWSSQGLVASFSRRDIPPGELDIVIVTQFNTRFNREIRLIVKQSHLARIQ